MRKAEEERALELLSQPLESLAAYGFKAESLVRRGSPAGEIIKTCRNIQADLVVVGLKGISDAPEFLLGSIAHKVIKYAPCSVIVVKRETKAMNRVLVPIDRSKHFEEVEIGGFEPPTSAMRTQRSPN